jgi:hypothetical protein
MAKFNMSAKWTNSLPIMILIAVFIFNIITYLPPTIPPLILNFKNEIKFGFAF